MRAHAGAGPAESRELGAWLVVVREGPVARLRVGHDASGTRLVPTAKELAADAERQIAALRAELERLRRG